MIEEWKDVEGLEGFQVSSLGRVQSFRRPVPRILKPQLVGGYPTVYFKRKGFGVHRLVAQAFIPNPDNKPLVCHKDDTPTNNQVTNLWWGTPSDNNKDCWDKKRTRGNYKHGQIRTPEYRKAEFERMKERRGTEEMRRIWREQYHKRKKIEKSY